MMPLLAKSLGFVSAEKVEQKEVSWFTGRVKSDSVSLAIQSPWLALGGPFHSSFAQMGSEISLASFNLCSRNPCLCYGEWRMLTNDSEV